MNRNNIAIPETGWTCIAVHDLNNRMDSNTQNQYLKCEKCNNEKVRFVHILRHPDYPKDLCVGRVCAERITGDSVGLMEKESALRRKAKRRQSFCNGDWKLNYDKQTYSRRYKGEYITLKKYKNGNWCVIFKNNFYDYRDGYRIRTFEEAKSIAFDIFEKKMNIG